MYGTIGALRSLESGNDNIGLPLHRDQGQAGKQCRTFKAANLPEAELVRQAQAGCNESLDELLKRHWRWFLKQAQMACQSATDADDICQNAFLKAISKLQQLSCPDRFRTWMLSFINNESRNWKRNLKKVGTREQAMDTYLIESLSVEDDEASADDFDYVMAELLKGIRTLGEPGARVGSFMIDYFRQEGQLPPVRAIAASTGSTQGTAQRSREAVLGVWRRVLAETDVKKANYSRAGVRKR